MKTLFLLPVFLLCTLFAHAQDGSFHRPYYCGNDSLLALMLGTSGGEGLRQQIAAPQAAISTRLTAVSSQRTLPVVTIPVVVHVVSDPGNSATNISDQQVFDQIAALNNEFNVVNSTNIYFCLAQVLPDQTTTWTPYNGNGTRGITRTSNANIANHNMNYEQGLLNSVAVGFDPERYMNIWVVAGISGFVSNVLGYAPRPIIPNSILDGVVIRYDVFGDNRICSCHSLLTGYDEGKVLVHEVGHYLGLYHTFQNGIYDSDPPCQNNDCTVDGDLVCDTPPVAAANYSCPSLSSCSTDANMSDPNNPITSDINDDVTNYMDYTDDGCKNSFTVPNTYSQAPRMHATIQALRAKLVSPENLCYTGVGIQCNTANPVLVADFYVPETEVCSGGSLTFSPVASNNTASIYSWTFNGGSPSTSGSGAPVTVTYSSPGMYTATLDVMDSFTSASYSVTIYVTNCTVSDPTQSNWYFGDHASLLFTTGSPPSSPAPPPGAMYGSEGVTSLSDGSGNALFYTNGQEIYEATGHTVVSGGPMNGSPNTTTSSNPFLLASAAQGTVSFPDPSGSGYYYVFTASDFGTTQNLLSYSLYDPSGPSYVSMDNPAGSAGEESTEHIGAVPDCDDQGYWVVTHGIYAPYDDQLLAYHVTSAGVNSTPVTSQSYTVNSTPGGDQIGQIDFSRDGSRMAVAANPGLQIYNFDRQSGACVLVTSVNINALYYSACFSPNGQFLYTLVNTSNGADLIQLDLSDIDCGNQPQATHISDYGVYSTLNTLQLGPDDRIYITTMNFFSGDNKLSIINYPDQPGLACGFNKGAISMVEQQPRMGLPNMIDGLHNPTPVIRYCLSNCQFHFTTSGCGSTYAWDFGDGVGTSSAADPTYTYTVTGTYTVSVTIDGNPATPVVVNATGVPAIFAINSNSPKEFVRLDPATGLEQQTVAVMTGLAGSYSGSSTFDPNHNRFIFSGSSSAGSFFNIDVTNGNVVASSPAATGIDFEYDVSSNRMYGINQSVSPIEFCEFDPLTGAIIGGPIYTFPSNRGVVAGSSTYDQVNHVYIIHAFDFLSSGPTYHYRINLVSGIVNIASVSHDAIMEYEYNNTNSTLYSYLPPNSSTPTIETINYSTGAQGMSPVGTLTGMVNVYLGCTTFDPATNTYYLSGSSSGGTHYVVDCTSGSVSNFTQTNSYIEYEFAACAPVCPTCRYGAPHNEQTHQPQAASELIAAQPNPTNDFTTFSYHIAQEGKVTIDLVDITGKRVAQLLNGISQPAGDFQLQWNTAALAPGIYYCRLLTTSGQTNIKLIISR